jgi:hypothetical protein
MPRKTSLGKFPLDGSKHLFSRRPRLSLGNIRGSVETVNGAIYSNANSIPETADFQQSVPGSDTNEYNPEHNRTRSGFPYLTVPYLLLTFLVTQDANELDELDLNLSNAGSDLLNNGNEEDRENEEDSDNKSLDLNLGKLLSIDLPT